MYVGRVNFRKFQLKYPSCILILNLSFCGSQKIWRHLPSKKHKNLTMKILFAPSASSLNSINSTFPLLKPGCFGLNFLFCCKMKHERAKVPHAVEIRVKIFWAEYFDMAGRKLAEKNEIKCRWVFCCCCCCCEVIGRFAPQTSPVLGDEYAFSLKSEVISERNPNLHLDLTLSKLISAWINGFFAECFDILPTTPVERKLWTLL